MIPEKIEELAIHIYFVTGNPVSVTENTSGYDNEHYTYILWFTHNPLTYCHCSEDTSIDNVPEIIDTMNTLGGNPPFSILKALKNGKSWNYP